MSLIDQKHRAVMRAWSQSRDIDNCDDNCDDNDKVVSKLFVKSPGFSLYRLDLSGHGTGDYGQVN